MPKEQSKAKKRREEVRKAKQRLWNTEDGKLVLDDLMRRYHIMGCNFDEDPGKHAFHEGERNVVLDLIDSSVTTPDEYRKRYEDVKTQGTLEWGED